MCTIILLQPVIEDPAIAEPVIAESVIAEPFEEQLSSDSDDSNSNTSSSTSSTFASTGSGSTATTSLCADDSIFDDSGITIEDVQFSDDTFDTQPLHPGSTLSVLATLAILFSWFTAFPGVSKEALSQLLSILHHFILPAGNQLPSSYATAFGLIKSLLVSEEDYHCCINDCVIFRGVNKDDTHCPKCNEARYVQGKDIPRKRFKYLPLMPRLQRLFSIACISQLLQNHSLTTNEVLPTKVSDIHQTETWRKWYSPEGPFAGDARGISLAICADGTAPFSKEKISYSMWPLVVSILNLPTHLRRLPGFLQLIGIIPGKAEPKNIDPYVEIFVEELKQLNESKIPVFDAFQKKNFLLKADIFLHVTDYPGQNKLFHCNG